MENPSQAKLEIFKQSFSSHRSGCRRECHCGKEFYDQTNSYDWEPNELDDLAKDPNAFPLNYPVETISIEGYEYVKDCSCWHKHARVVISFLESHAQPIAQYFKLKKIRRLAIAKLIPNIDP